LGVASWLIIAIQLSVFFEPAPEPTPPPADFGRVITIAGLCLAGTAVVLCGASGIIGMNRTSLPLCGGFWCLGLCHAVDILIGDTGLRRGLACEHHRKS